MSKSLGNFMTVQAAAARVGGEAVRLFVIGTHYRSPLDFSPERLDESARALTRIYETLARPMPQRWGRVSCRPIPACSTNSRCNG